MGAAEALQSYSFQRGAFSSPWGDSCSLRHRASTVRCVFDSCDSEGVCWIVQATTRSNIFKAKSWLQPAEGTAQTPEKCTRAERKAGRGNSGCLTQSCSSHQAHLDTFIRWLGKNGCWGSRAGSVVVPLQKVPAALFGYDSGETNCNLGLKAEKHGQQHFQTIYLHRFVDNRVSSDSISCYFLCSSFWVHR